MAHGDSEMKVKLMQTLRKEIKDTWDGTQDPVIAAYLKKMLKEGINYEIWNANLFYSILIFVKYLLF